MSQIGTYPSNTEELAKKWGVQPTMVAHLRKSIGELIGFAVASGVPATAFAALTGDEIRQALEQAPNAAAYATPEEGLAMLLNEEGGCADIAEAAGLYRKPKPVSSAAVTERIRNGDMIAYKTGAGQYRVPRWQFRREGGLLPGLPEAIKALRESDAAFTPLTPFAFFLQTHPLTGERTPLEVLRSGDSDTVIRAAKSEAE